MEIELRHLRYFVAVAEERHFGRAAQRLHIAQPPLSRQIALLEREIGADLLDRSTRPIRLTAPGAVFLREARMILDQAARAIERGRRTARGERGHLSVAAVPWAYNDIVPAVARAFCAVVPGASLELSIRAPRDQIDAVEKEWLDIAFTRPAVETRTVQVEPLLRQTMVAAVPRRHPLARRDEISFEELAEEALVSVAEEAAPGFVYEQTNELARRGLAPALVHEAPGPLSQLALIGAGVGVGLHLAAAGTVPHRDVVLIPLTGEAPAPTLALAWRRDDDRQLVRTLLATAREVAETLQAPAPSSPAGAVAETIQVDAGARTPSAPR